MQSSRRGLFITLEGTEGAGKSTQTQLLADRLRQLGATVKALREPGGTTISEEIRRLLKHPPESASIHPLTELLLVCASRAQLIEEVIQPAMVAGEVVVCDRFTDSTIAYQGFGRGLPLDLVKQAAAIATSHLTPDLTLLLKVSKDIAQSRMHGRHQSTGETRDRFEQAEQAFFDRVENGFDQLANDFPNRIKVIDANGAPEKVASAIWAQVEPLITSRK